MQGNNRSLIEPLTLLEECVRLKANKINGLSGLNTTSLCTHLEPNIYHVNKGRVKTPVMLW